LAVGSIVDLRHSKDNRAGTVTAIRPQVLGWSARGARVTRRIASDPLVRAVWPLILQPIGTAWAIW